MDRSFDPLTVTFDWRKARIAAERAGDERQTWAYDWPQGGRLADRLSELIEIPGKTIIDLGCGRGQLGWQAWRLGALSVTFLDASQQIADFHNTVIETNKLSSSCTALLHRWGDDLPQLQADLILCGDILYRPECHADIAHDLAQFLKADGLAIMTDPREQIEPAFYQHLEDHGLNVRNQPPADEKGTWLFIQR